MDAKPVPRVSDSAGQGGTQGCISNKFLIQQVRVGPKAAFLTSSHEVLLSSPDCVSERLTV